MHRLAWGSAFILMAVGLALAQPAPDGGPFGLVVHGAFRDLVMQGDFAPKIGLETAMASRPSIGVGAVAAARGEITVIDGRAIVAYGKPEAAAPAGGEGAALLATARATAWRTIPVGFDVEPEKVEAFLANRARAAGIDPDKSFPFQVSGVVAPFAMHVNAAPTAGPHGMNRPMAIAIERKGAAIAGRVAGLYVAPALMGIVTHGGERVHAHWVDPDGSETAHLERWGIKSGSVLLLPKTE